MVAPIRFSRSMAAVFRRSKSRPATCRIWASDPVAPGACGQMAAVEGMSAARTRWRAARPGMAEYFREELRRLWERGWRRKGSVLRLIKVIGRWRSLPSVRPDLALRAQHSLPQVWRRGGSAQDRTGAIGPERKMRSEGGWCFAAPVQAGEPR